MNLVEHECGVKVLLVVVRDDHELMAFVSERPQCVQRAINHCGRVGRSPGGMPFIMANRSLQRL